ncbi:hypothetical protein VTO73DRAFT_10191 [Trametes versicolor]
MGQASLWDPQPLQQDANDRARPKHDSQGKLSSMLAYGTPVVHPSSAMHRVSSFRRTRPSYHPAVNNSHVAVLSRR